ncbi:MAG: UvrD-helicase domain-containing protein [Tannerellaceae bacterium]|jgi:ATP-dependent exoDNAse (exonuclease V) beta subunit|nr:UvrD-helicase domain-containing protein [Tannerellaceae bacterium]
MLTIYKASAGSGKTYTLTGEYLRLLFTHSHAYRRILAVTFTNKATDEMKRRIIEELYRLASGRESAHLFSLQQAGNWTEEAVRHRAKEMLDAILDDYSAFHISTIDSFFQQTLHAFTREIGLQGGYNIEMDTGIVLEEAIDRLLAQLDKTQNKNLLNWLLRFAEDRIESGDSWDIRNSLATLGKEIFSETFKSLDEQALSDLANKDLLDACYKELQTTIATIESKARQLGQEGLDTMQRYDLVPTDFRGNSRSPFFFFEKLAGGEMKEPTPTFLSLADNIDQWYTKTSPHCDAIHRTFEELNPCILRVIHFFDHLIDYYTAREIIRYFHVLGILSDISHSVADFREEENILLIADTTELIRRVIDGSDVPFIYEKTGVRIDHYMIDEFQDTSRMQWHNFRPLIRESLATGHHNFIVGDVKQSIYRFRNSDWQLLDNQIRQDLSTYLIQEKTLTHNYRSCPHIVTFNNHIFVNIPHRLQDLYNQTLSTSSLSPEQQASFTSRITDAYAHTTQQIPTSTQQTDGHVRIEFIPTDDEKSDWKTLALERLPTLLQQLQDNDYAPCDIAILVRTNHEAATVANYLLAFAAKHPDNPYCYDITSEDALLISAAPSVRALIALLRMVNSPNPTTQAFVRYALMPLNVYPLPLPSLLPTDLYRCIETLYHLYASYFPTSDQAYLYGFFDVAADFVRKDSTDIGRFLRWWDCKGKNKPIAPPDTHNTIRILTIHKAKGLGFKAVIIPLAEWDIDHHPAHPVTLWCQPKNTLFHPLRLIPLRYGKALACTHFANDYFREKLFTCIDSLNTLYVACTRAERELIVLAPHLNPSVPTIAGLLNQALNSADNFFELGEWTSAASGETRSVIPTTAPLHCVPIGHRLRFRTLDTSFLFILILSLIGCSTTRYVPQGEYLLHKVTLSCDNPDFTSADLRPYLRQQPNPKLLGFLPWFRYIGEDPVLLDTAFTEQSVTDLKQYLQSRGYFHSQVYSTLDTADKKAHLIYHIHPGQSHRIRNYRHTLPDPIIDSIADRHTQSIVGGDAFDLDILNKERQSITTLLRQHGYYAFNRDHLGFLVDSSSTPPFTVDLALTLRPFRLTLPDGSVCDTTHQPYFIRSVNFPSETILRTSVFQRACYILPQRPYDEQSIQQTYVALSALKALKRVYIRFDETYGQDSLLLDCTILAMTEETQGISLEAEGTNSAGDLGIASAFTYQHRNLFRGSEIFSLRLRGAFESLLHGSAAGTSYREFTTQASLVFPRFLFPLLPDKRRGIAPASTELRLTYNAQSRPEYDRSIVAAAWTYLWEPRSHTRRNRARHTFRFLDLDYVFLPRIRVDFRDSLPKSMQLYNYADQFILSTAYTFSMSTAGKEGERFLDGTKSTAMRLGIEVSGNTLQLFSQMLGAPRNEERRYQLLGINFSQFVKVDFDVSRSLMLDMRNVLALHAAVGIAVPYGNSPLLPFERRYFAGGANSLRGWSVRELGPGSMNMDPISRNTRFALQAGDIQLEMNIEYRTRLLQRVELAAFVDAGNVWTIRSYVDQPGGDFAFSRFYKEIAASYGLGVRFDFNYFLLRVDGGLKAYDPQQTSTERWRAILNPNLGKNFALHLAIGYPF